MSTSNKNTPTVGTEYSAQNPTTTETVPTIYACALRPEYLMIRDVQVRKITAKHIFVILRINNVDEFYWPTYTLDRADLEAGKPCSRKFVLRRLKRAVDEDDLLEITKSHHIIEFSFSEAVANSASRIGYDFQKAISKIHGCELYNAGFALEDLVVLGTSIPADNQLRLCVETLASIMDSIPVSEEIPKVD